MKNMDQTYNIKVLMTCSEEIASTFISFKSNDVLKVVQFWT